MIIAATFEYSLYLELAISDLEKRGIPRENIGAIPLDKQVADRKIFDSIHRSDGISLFDGAAAMATVFALLGAIYGFILAWGPIIWMIIGLITGAIVGFIMDYSIGKIRSLKNKKGSRKRDSVGDKAADVVLIINCEINKNEMVEKVLWDNLAMGVGVLSENRLVNK
jgi:uncharacterized membrane protein